MRTPDKDNYATVTKHVEIHGTALRPGQVIRYKELNDLVLNLIKMNAISLWENQAAPYKGFEVK